MKNTICFDSTDWNSIRDMIDKIHEVGQMLFGKTSKCETIIYSIYKDEDGNESLQTEVFQTNGWIRTNIYHPEDYTIEELYKKEK